MMFDFFRHFLPLLSLSLSHSLPQAVVRESIFFSHSLCQIWLTPMALWLPADISVSSYKVTAHAHKYICIFLQFFATPPWQLCAGMHIKCSIRIESKKMKQWLRAKTHTLKSLRCDRREANRSTIFCKCMIGCSIHYIPTCYSIACASVYVSADAYVCVHVYNSKSGTQQKAIVK